MAEVKINIPHKLKFLFEPHRIKCLYGGRGSAKSWSIARALIVSALQAKTRILCTREVQKSLRDSVHRLISDQIEMLGLGKYFDITRDEIRCLPTGSQFLFAGLASNTVESIKSYESVDKCWVEEGQCVSERSWEILTPTIRAPGSEIWISCNPELATDPTYVRYIANADEQPDCVSVLVNYSDNPHFPDVLRQEMEYMKTQDYDNYLHIWEGQCKSRSDASVFGGKVVSYEFTPDPLWSGPYYGLDFGFAADPTALVKMYVSDDNDLYVEREAWELHIETDMMPALFDEMEEGTRKYVIRADNSRPETISYLKRHGYPRVIPCKKWKNSDLDGIDFMRSFNSIVIHPRCKHSLEEFSLYCYKVDKLSGDIQPELTDRLNHCLVPGTLIQTSRGKIPIEEVGTGDMALTRGGYRPVLWGGISDTNRQVCTVTTDSGHSVTGTPDHKIFTDRGWVRIDALRYGDSIIHIGDPICQSKLNTTATHTIAIQNPHKEQTDYISVLTLPNDQDWTISKEFAQSAEMVLPLTDSTAHKLAVSRVVCVSDTGIAPQVYDLTIDELHEFFANDMLVLNCIDAARYGLEPLVLGQKRKIEDRPDSLVQDSIGRWVQPSALSRVYNPHLWIS